MNLQSVFLLMLMMNMVGKNKRGINPLMYVLLSAFPPTAAFNPIGGAINSAGISGAGLFTGANPFDSVKWNPIGNVVSNILTAPINLSNKSTTANSLPDVLITGGGVTVYTNPYDISNPIEVYDVGKYSDNRYVNGFDE